MNTIPIIIPDERFSPTWPSYYVECNPFQLKTDEFVLELIFTRFWNPDAKAGSVGWLATLECKAVVTAMDWSFSTTTDISMRSIEALSSFLENPSDNLTAQNGMAFIGSSAVMSPSRCGIRFFGGKSRLEAHPLLGISFSYGTATDFQSRQDFERFESSSSIENGSEIKVCGKLESGTQTDDVQNLRRLLNAVRSAV